VHSQLALPPGAAPRPIVLVGEQCLERSKLAGELIEVRRNVALKLHRGVAARLKLLQLLFHLEGHATRDRVVRVEGRHRLLAVIPGLRQRTHGFRFAISIG
jgi:hypothetical protein